MKVIALLSVFLTMVGASVGMASAQEAPTANDFAVDVPFGSLGFEVEYADHVSSNPAPGRPLLVEILSFVQPSPDGGGIEVDNNRILYTPVVGGAPINGGTFTVQYRVTDEDSGAFSDAATITLNVATKPNAGPPDILLNPISRGADAGEPLRIDLGRFIRDAGDIPAQGDEDEDLTLTISQTPQKGNATVDGLVIVYTANADESGQDTIGYTVTDTGGESSDGTVTIDISPAVAVEPVTLTAVDDGASVPQDSNVNIAVLNNDSVMPANTTVTVSIVTDATSGATVVNSDNSVTYTPNMGFSGTDTFTYQITGGGETSNTATVTITVVAPEPTPNRNPTVPPTISVNAGTGETTIDLTTSISDPDGDTLTITIPNQPSQGTATVRGTMIIYTPDPGAVGTDTITYEVSDGQGGSTTGTITITLTGDVAAPEAAPSRVCAR